MARFSQKGLFGRLVAFGSLPQEAQQMKNTNGEHNGVTPGRHKWRIATGNGKGCKMININFYGL